jgi:hypothetical protein
MKFQYLGTAAYEGIPAFFCNCENCKKSRNIGGKAVRTRSQAIIDETLLIDFPADTYIHPMNIYQVSFLYRVYYYTYCVPEKHPGCHQAALFLYNPTIDTDTFHSFTNLSLISCVNHTIPLSYYTNQA